MTFESLQKDIVKTIDIKNKVKFWSQWITENPKEIKKVWKIIIEDEQAKSWHYAYLFDNVNDLKPKLIEPFIEKIIAHLPKLKNHSTRRHFVRILATHKILKDEKLQTVLLDECFKYLQSAEIKVAVKAHALAICVKFCEIYPELKQEFCDILKEGMEKNSSAFKVRAKAILKKFENE